MLAQHMRIFAGPYGPCNRRLTSLLRPRRIARTVTRAAIPSMRNTASRISDPALPTHIMFTSRRTNHLDTNPLRSSLRHHHRVLRLTIGLPTRLQGHRVLRRHKKPSREAPILLTSPQHSPRLSSRPSRNPPPDTFEPCQSLLNRGKATNFNLRLLHLPLSDYKDDAA